ncbi:MAG: DM13 domain-containing protein [Pseudomonadota bacterium]
MKKRDLLGLVITHIATGALGFATGIYMLPILIAPPSPDAEVIEARSHQARYSGTFDRLREGSDTFHWGEGTVYIENDRVSFIGELAPGPDYKLYLSPSFIETEATFNDTKSSMVRIGSVDTFENFEVMIPPGIDPAQFNTVIVWCESFQEFISSAKYQ